MPTLADIYSAINTAKRKTSDFIQNPGTSLEQMLGYANDRARVYNQQMTLAGQGTMAQARGQQPTPEQEAANKEMQETWAGAYNPAGMISKTLEAKFPNVSLSISENPKSLDLSKIVVPKELRGQGIGTNVMNDLIQYADETGKKINLTPSADFGGNVNRLKSFYKDFGFVENKGKNKDFTTRETMIRNPQIQETKDVSYRGSHTAPGPDFGAPLYDLTGGGQMYPSDVYSASGARIYGTGYPQADKEAFALAKQVRGNPNADVLMFRAVPKNESIKSINPGDWVTLSKSYAKTHGEAVLGKDYKIIEQKVKAKDLWTNADSIHEFGYHPAND